MDINFDKLEDKDVKANFKQYMIDGGMAKLPIGNYLIESMYEAKL